MARRSSAAALVSVMAMLSGPAATVARAQAPAGQPGAAATADGPLVFTTPDGSRFVLVPDAGVSLVHWAIATMAHDPPAFPGLCAVTMRAALGGTWRSGSRDPERERQALDDHDAAYHTFLGNPADAAAGAELLRLSKALEQFGDPVAHGRLLASVPMHRPEVTYDPPVCLYVTTTVPDALQDVARRLLERREATALRDLQAAWVQTVLARAEQQRQDDRTALHAEVLALAMPDHPFLRQLERPGLAAPRRSEAMATWQAMQRPERTIHVLYGGFDATSAQAMLQGVFATTGLPPAELLPPVRARPISSLRRSVVPGARVPTVAIAFVLPPDVDRDVLAVAVHWLADGPDSRLGQELPRRGRAQATVSCMAPWPRTVDGASLLLLEVADAGGIEGLADLCRKAARDVAAAVPTPASLETALATVQREWTTAVNDPRQFAMAIAEAALLWPRRPPPLCPPDRVDAGAVRRLLLQILDTQPVVVEARP